MSKRTHFGEKNESRASKCSHQIADIYPVFHSVVSYSSLRGNTVSCWKHTTCWQSIFITLPEYTGTELTWFTRQFTEDFCYTVQYFWHSQFL